MKLTTQIKDTLRRLKAYYYYSFFSDLSVDLSKGITYQLKDGVSVFYKILEDGRYQADYNGQSAIYSVVIKTAPAPFGNYNVSCVFQIDNEVSWEEEPVFREMGAFLASSFVKTIAAHHIASYSDEVINTISDQLSLLTANDSK